MSTQRCRWLVGSENGEGEQARPDTIPQAGSRRKNGFRQRLDGASAGTREEAGCRVFRARVGRTRLGQIPSAFSRAPVRTGRNVQDFRGGFFVCSVECSCGAWWRTRLAPAIQLIVGTLSLQTVNVDGERGRRGRCSDEQASHCGLAGWRPPREDDPVDQQWIADCPEAHRLDMAPAAGKKANMHCSSVSVPCSSFGTIKEDRDSFTGRELSGR